VPDNVSSVDTGHAHIGDNDVKTAAIELLNPFVSIFSGFNPVTKFGQYFPNYIQDSLVIVNH
jgi:hypothetical protein